MTTDTQPRQLVDAAMTLAQTTHRLRALRKSALGGGGFDPEDFDAAVLAFRRARSGAARLRCGDGDRQHFQSATAA